MVLSKRERYIALATLAAVGILVLDHFVLTPLIEASDDLQRQIDNKQAVQSANRKTLQAAKLNKDRWGQMQRDGLRRRDASEAEGEVMKEVRNWAQQAGLNLSLIKADRSEKEKVFQKSTIRVTASGGMSQIARFMWYVQTANIPIRFNEAQLNTHKEGTDDLTLQAALGTIYLLPDGGAAAPQPATAPWPREARQ